MTVRAIPFAVMTCVVGVIVGAQQTVVAQLGLTETAARQYLMKEITAPASDRSSDLVIAGTRGFLKLPAAARGPAATGLFAWAKAYVSTPAFNTAYQTFRNEQRPGERTYERTVKDEVRKQLDDLLVGAQRLREMAASQPAAQRPQMIKAAEGYEAQAQDPKYIKSLEDALQSQRDLENADARARIAKLDAQFPAYPKVLFARRLREFLDITADVNFAARTISLTGGVDGVELVDAADRKRHWIWQEAVIVGREATTAARAAAEAWLKELGR